MTLFSKSFTIVFDICILVSKIRKTLSFGKLLRIDIYVDINIFNYFEVPT